MEKSRVRLRISLVVLALCLAALCLLAFVFVGCGSGDGENNAIVHKIVYQYVAEEGGVISGESRQELSPREEGSFVFALPDSELGYYRFIGWSDGLKAAVRQDSYDFNLVDPIAQSTVITYTAMFKRVYRVQYNCDIGGDIFGYAVQDVVDGGETATVTAKDVEGYKFLTWSDGVTTESRSDTVENKDLSVTAYFRPLDMSSRYEVNGGGSVSLVYNDDGLDSTVTVFAMPDYGYEFKGWSDDLKTLKRTDKSFGTDRIYTALFAKKKFAVEYGVSGGGVLAVGDASWDGLYNTIVEYGDDVDTIKAVSNAGYEFTNWSDGIKTAERTDRNIKRNMSVTAVFVKKEYTLSYSATVGGEVLGELNQTVKYDEDGTPVTAVAKSGYCFVKWSDGVTTAERTDINVAAGKSVTAEFSRNEFSVIYESSEYGSLSGDTEQVVVRHGSGTPVVALPNDGYEFTGWSDGVTTAERTDINVQDDIFVKAVFEPTLLYELNDGETGYIVSARYDYLFTEIEIPDTHNGLPVTEIAKGGFRYGQLTAITIPNTVKKIGIAAFVNLQGLTEIFIPDSVESIENGAFAACVNLQSVTGMNCVKSIGSGAFMNCTSLDNLVLPTTLEELGSRILANYKNTVYVQMTKEDMEDLNPDWADIMGDTAEIVYTVKSVLYTLNYVAGDGGKIVGGSVQYVAEGHNGTAVTAVANRYCEFVGWSDGVQTAERQDRAVNSDITVTAIFKESLFSFIIISDTECSVRLFDKTATKAVVPARTSIDGKIYTVTEVAINGFSGSQDLTEVILPDTVTTIRSNAFSNCQNLTSITFSNVQVIGTGAFNRCYSLESIVIPETVISVGSQIFHNCNTQVYVRADAQPEGWSESWNINNENQDVVFGYKD